MLLVVLKYSEQLNVNSIKIKAMLSLIEVLRNNNAVIDRGNVMISCRDIDKAVTEYAHSHVISELEDLLNRHSTQAYWPAIIKERIKQLKGE